jgi:2-polyprenyl-6-methoxyphenol hydroxylase-like FAD-dependent oxidoreductase
MAPIRAQGINLAFRDAIVAANHLVPLLQADAPLEAIDAVLPTIQAEREPEIIRCQTLQHREQAQSTLITRSAPLRSLLTWTAPLLRPVLERQWLARQKPLRFGLHPVQLRV